MKGSVKRRCGCKTDDGRQAGTRCPKLRNARHGTWYYVADLGEGPDGRRRQHKRSGFTTKTAAQDALDILLGRVRDGGNVDDRETVADWLRTWLDGKARLRPSTRRGYVSHVEAYLIPQIGQVPLEGLRAEHLRRAYAAILADPSRRTGPETLRRVHSTMTTALKSAVKQQRIRVNPAEFVELGERARTPVRPWTPQELGRFLDHAVTTRLGVLFEVMAATGMRRGEAVALLWEDVDLAAGTLQVSRNAVEVGTQVIVGQPKTKSGHRLVELDGRTVGALIAHQMRQADERVAAGGAWVETGLVFTREDGVMLRPRWVSWHFQRLTADAGLRRVRLHDLRHGAASIALAAQVPIEIISKQLGHSTTSITADLYQHLLPGVGRQAAEASSALVPRTPVTIRDHPGERIPSRATGGTENPQVRAAEGEGFEPSTGCPVAVFKSGDSRAE